MSTLNLLRDRRSFILFTALALGACELPAKVGDLPETGTDTAAETATDTGGDPSATGSESGDDTTGDIPVDPTPGSGADTSDTGPLETTGDPTDEPAGCQALTLVECLADAACQPLYGEPLIPEGCMVGPQEFVTCLDAGLECDDAESIVCDDEGGYKIPITCELPGLEPCTPMCGDNECEGLDEASCGDNPLCKPVHGNPHVQGGVGVCVDENTTAYLGCLLDTGACPPNIPTVCPEGAPDEAYSVPSGCVPSHFVPCGDEGLAACE